QAGPTQPKKVVGCKPPSTRGWLTNDDYKYYPTSEREWEATGQKDSDADPYESVTKDKVIMKMPVTVRFTLKTDCKTLQDFYVKYGRRYDVEFKNDGTYDETGANYNQAWLTVLRKLVANPTDQTLDRIVQGYNWQDVWNDPGTKTKIEQQLTADLRSKSSLLVQTAHKAYFDDITVLVGKPIPPKALGDQVAETQTRVAKAEAEEAQANADKLKAEAQTKVALAEGAKQRAIIEGFGGIEGYLKYQCILQGCNPYQPSYGTALTPAPK
ncbi:MAG TPA: SPFH domain-containing protein, partial [Actinomycetes bacterium]|nr:SPFH domain-containing protein [Actinomycetes bacterium]